MTDQLKSVGYSAGSVSAGVAYGYDAKGRVQTRQFAGESGQESFTYDLASRLHTVSWAEGGGAPTETQRFEYDTVGYLKTLSPGHYTLTGDATSMFNTWITSWLK